MLRKLYIFFGNDNSNRRMCCSSFGIRIGSENIIMLWILEVFITGILHNFGNDKINCRIIGIGNGNFIWVWLGY